MAFVTGGATGIGRAIALRFAEAGAEIVLHYHRSKDDAEAVADLVRAQGLSCRVLSADLSDRAAVLPLAERAEAVHGHVDVLVNNAGVTDAPIDRGLPPPPLDRTLAEWDRVLDVNARAPLTLALRLAPGMAARGAGAIVNVASVAGTYALTDAPLYSLSKAMLAHLTRQLALRLAPAVRVNAIAPGWTATGFAGGAARDPAFAREIVATIPAGRIAEPEEVAEAALFLATTPYATGVVLPLDGGLRADLA